MDIYRELILDHYKNPRNFGHLKNPHVKQEEGNVTCGDKISIEIRFAKNDERHARRQAGITINDIRFSGEGCAISQAAASMLTEKVNGMKIEDVMKLKTGDILDMLGTTLTPSRIQCAMLSLEVLQKAITQYGR